MRARLRHQLRVDLAAPATARRLLREWLTGWRWPPREIGDVVLAASEAVSNAVEHAAATQVTVHAVLEPLPDPVLDPVPDLMLGPAADLLAGSVTQSAHTSAPAGAAADGTLVGSMDAGTLNGQLRRARVEVVDNGRWLPPGAHANTDSYRGLVLMHACVDLVEIDTTSSGTQVRLTTRPVHPTRHRDGA